MKTIILISIPFIMFASSEILYTGKSLSNREHMSLHTYNHRPSVKMKNKRRIYKLAKVNKSQAKQIVKEETKEEVEFMKLTHHKKYLIYKVSTKQYDLTINALDGTVIKKQKN